MDKIEVSQSDRQAATDFADWHEGFKSPEEVYQLARAFAMHRIEAATALETMLEALEDARLQLEYVDERFPTGTTPAILARVSAAIAKVKEG